VGSHPEQRDVLCVYPLRYVSSRAFGYQDKDGKDQVKDPHQRRVGGEPLLIAAITFENIPQRVLTRLLAQGPLPRILAPFRQIILTITPWFIRANVATPNLATFPLARGIM
jgi:hypothetical protein